MAFADPQSVTINAVAVALPRVSTSGTSSSYQNDNGLVRMTVAHSGTKRFRRTIRLDHSKVAPDPLISAQNIKYGMSAYLVVDVPPTGYTNAEQKQIVDALVAYLTATTGARVTQLLGSEN